MRCLILDDDLKSSLRLKRFLEEEAFVVDHATELNRGRYLARVTDYDLLIIHQTVQGDFGHKLCEELRSEGRMVPIICLLASSSLEQRLKHFVAGADDCLTPPFAFRELLARIRAILRRGANFRSEILSGSGITLNCRTQRVRVGKQTVLLSKKEYSLLAILMRNKGAVVARSAILEHVWDLKGDHFSNSLEAHIFSLRKKLGNRGRAAIKNVQGRGYLLEE